MDNTLGTLKACKHLALSSNCIEKITGLKGLGECEAVRLPLSCACAQSFLSLSGFLRRQFGGSLAGKKPDQEVGGVGRCGEHSEGVVDFLQSARQAERPGKGLTANFFALSNLVVVYMSNNLIAKWPEFDRFKDLAKLEELLFVGNPLWETHTKAEDFRLNVAGRIPWLKKLDGVPVDDDEKERGKALVG
eukprot:3255201-Rhodomonas_salina.3